jgi:hypothetical protein
MSIQSPQKQGNKFTPVHLVTPGNQSTTPSRERGEHSNRNLPHLGIRLDTIRCRPMDRPQTFHADFHSTDLLQLTAKPFAGVPNA